MLCRSSIDIIGSKCIKRAGDGDPLRRCQPRQKAELVPVPDGRWQNDHQNLHRALHLQYRKRHHVHRRLRHGPHGDVRLRQFAAPDQRNHGGALHQELYLSRHLLHPHDDADRQRVLLRPLLRLVESHCKLHIRRDGEYCNDHGITTRQSGGL